jgi:hypothetical protein
MPEAHRPTAPAGGTDGARQTAIGERSERVHVAARAQRASEDSFGRRTLQTGRGRTVSLACPAKPIAAGPRAAARRARGRAGVRTEGALPVRRVQGGDQLGQQCQSSPGIQRSAGEDVLDKRNQDSARGGAGTRTWTACGSRPVASTGRGNTPRRDLLSPITNGRRARRSDAHRLRFPATQPARRPAAAKHRAPRATRSHEDTRLDSEGVTACAGAARTWCDG